MKSNVKKSLKQIIVFSIIGAFNTVADFVIFNILFGMAHFSLIIANVIAVTLVMGVSLQLNRRYVFKGSNKSLAVHGIKFGIVTLSGLYVIQNVILLAVLHMLQGMHGLTGLLANGLIQANIAKVIGVGASAIWDFVLYKIWVFRDATPEQESESAVDAE